MISLENVPKTGRLAPLGMQVKDFGSQAITELYSVASEFLQMPHNLFTRKRKRRISEMVCRISTSLFRKLFGKFSGPMLTQYSLQNVIIYLSLHFGVVRFMGLACVL